MKILDRYLAGAVMGGTLVTLAVLLPLMGFFLLADEMDQVGDNGYRFADAVLFVLLTMPRYAYQIFPIATLIGALIGLGSLAGRSELVAMRAAGVSIGRIIFAAMQGGALMAIAAVIVGEGVAPIAEQEALQLRSQAESGQVTLKTRYGFWARDGRSYINIHEILSGTHLRGIHIYEIDDRQRLRLATRAGDARYLDGRWVLEDISRSLIGEDRVEVSHLDRAGWSSLLDPALLQIVIVEPHVLPVWDLLRYVRYMTANAQDARTYEVAFWAKVIHPFLILSMIFVSIPIVLASARTVGLGSRMFLGVMVGMAFYLISRTFAYVALLYGLSPLLAALIPPLLFIAGALWVLRRAG